MQATVRSRLRKAYQEADAAQTLKALQKLAEELERDYPQAANSLREGLDETLTVHRFALSGTLRRVSWPTVGEWSSVSPECTDRGEVATYTGTLTGTVTLDSGATCTIIPTSTKATTA
jgi:hypothetical protein